MTPPEFVGMNMFRISRIDSLVRRLIRDHNDEVVAPLVVAPLVFVNGVVLFWVFFKMEITFREICESKMEHIGSKLENTGSKYDSIRELDDEKSGYIVAPEMSIEKYMKRLLFSKL